MKSFLTKIALVGGFIAAASLAAPNAQAATPEEELVKLGYPQINEAPPKPFGNYVNGHVAGKILYVSSAAPQDVNGLYGKKGGWIKGRYGEDLKADEKGIKIAELACFRSLRFAKAVIGDLSKIKQVLRMNVASLSTTGFKNHTKIADGCSNFLTTVFGDKGKHARVNIGNASMPFGIAMEITIIYEVE